MIVFRTGDDKDSLAGLVHEVAGSSPVGGAMDSATVPARCR